MSSTAYDHLMVGDIAAENPAAADVLDRLGVDFCCHGQTPFAIACGLAGQDPADVAKALDAVKGEALAGKPDFKAWPTDLLADYVLKIHHRGIRRDGPDILRLLEKVQNAHGDNHPELYEVGELFEASYNALLMHLQKEENVLFPYIYRLCQAKLQNFKASSFHCGSVAAPINVMEHEHADEGDRHARIEALTNGYTPPADACGSYALLLKKLKAFRDDLHEHIHLENNLIFPRALGLEKEVVDAD